ncbi:hypothetical protein F511_07928 [Dorcoceras hygrometricum]|uniref:Uncharacterized protein n=1 Tax=Dorcoceras hygrometricum TaxID=472368 RepID=A0A2Z7D153_9LAMI|nr:hypothetical protein F511_07928 [Dorcoceras hygrometricum]
MDLDRPNGPRSNNEHSVHLHHRDFIVTPIADQIGRIDSVSKTEYYDLKNHFSEPQCKMTVLALNSGKPRTCVTLNGSGIQLAVGPQPLWLRNHNSGPAQWIMVKRLATSPHDPLGITDSACKNQSVVVSVQYGPFNPYIPIRSTTIGKSRVAIDLIAMHTSWRSNSDIANIIGYPRMSASGESSTTMHRLLHASGSHPIPTPYDSRSVAGRRHVRWPPLSLPRTCARASLRVACKPRLVARRLGPLRAMVACCRTWRSAAVQLRLPRLSRASAALVARCGRHSRKSCAAGRAPLVAGRCDATGLLLCDGRRWEALVERHAMNCARPCVALGATSRAAALRFFVWRRRRPASAPAMS